MCYAYCSKMILQMTQSLTRHKTQEQNDIPSCIKLHSTDIPLPLPFTQVYLFIQRTTDQADLKTQSL